MRFGTCSAFMTPTLPPGIYADTLLPDIESRNDLLPDGTDNIGPYPWPRRFSPYPNLSLLPLAALQLDRSVEDGETRPVDMGTFYTDQDVDKTIYLVTLMTGTTPRDRHWAIRWQVEHRIRYEPALRCLEIIENFLINPHSYLINFGPLTTLHNLSPYAEFAIFPLQTLSLAQRSELEKISWNVGVAPPDGEFNCQNWVAAVLGVAVLRGLLDETTVRDVLENALEELPVGQSALSCTTITS